MTNELDFWILDNPKALGGDVAGMRSPDAATALVIDGFATANGKKFDFPPFGAGLADVTLMALPADVGNRLYEKMAGYVASRQSRTENVAEENEVLAAKWVVDADTVVVMAADSARGVGEFAQDAFERFLGFEKIQLHSSSNAVIAPGFDARKWLEGGDVSPGIQRVIEGLCAPPPKTAPSRRPKP